MAQGREHAEGTSHALVLTTLRQSGAAMTVQQVATAVRLSIATVRFHLSRLEADGLIRSEREQRAHRPGRPRVLYTARPSEAVDAGAAYRQLADVLARQLIAVAGTGGALAAGIRWAELLTSEDIDLEADPEALDRLMRFLGDSGFSPRSDGGTRIELHTCPFRELAKEQAEVVCTVHLGMIQGLLTDGTAAVRVIPVLDGSGPCLIQLPGDLAGHHRERASLALERSSKETAMPITPVVPEPDSIR